MFHGTHLVQRLKKPFMKLGMAIRNSFAFGGGFKDGGLNPEAAALLGEIFSFDYMGAAEYEFGAVADAFKTIAKSELVFGCIVLTEKDGCSG